jgi:hypothetical protein
MCERSFTLPLYTTPPHSSPSADAGHGSSPFRHGGREGIGSSPMRYRHGYDLATFASNRLCTKKNRNRHNRLSLLGLSIIAGGGFEPPTSGLWARRATRLLYPAIVVCRAFHATMDWEQRPTHKNNVSKHVYDNRNLETSQEKLRLGPCFCESLPQSAPCGPCHIRGSATR